MFLQRAHLICTYPLPLASSLPQYLQRISRKICICTHSHITDRMPRSLETKAALEVNAGLFCLAGVAVFPHRYVAVPLYF